MGKMYYTEEEAAQKLNMSAEELNKLTQEGKLSSYADGARQMYKADQVDALAPGGAAASSESEEIELAPAEAEDEGAGGGDRVDLSEADKDAEETSKEDTVLTSEGISIFDDEDLDIETGDPMAKTAIAPSVEEEISLEGVGSGSGLLDLTRESDDTSLGEVLEHIEVGSGIPSSPPPVEMEIPEEPAAESAAPAAVEAPTVVEEVDASAGAFSGLILATSLVLLLAGLAVLAVVMGEVPGYLQSLQQNLQWWLIGAVVVAVVLAVVGYMIGKAAAARAAALQRGG